jgi:hypothetical protein
MAFDQSTHKVEWWLDSNNTHPDLQQLLLQYLRGRGTVTCLECSTNLDLPHIMQDLVALQDIIGGITLPWEWSQRNFSRPKAHISHNVTQGAQRKMDIRVHHTAAAGDALPVDLQVRSGARSDHGDIDLSPQGQIAERD